MSHGPSSWVELFLFRVRTFLREPSALFWTFGFPVLTSVALGLAFRAQDLRELSVAVVDQEGAEALRATLDAAEGLAAQRAPLAQAEELLRRGRVALVVTPGAEPELLSDPTQPDGRTARLLALDALERARGRKDMLVTRRREVTAPGARYIDFLIPGILGMGLLSSGVWGVGWNLVEMRTGKLLKRLAATPMSRAQFLLSSVFTRGLIALLEILFFIGFARLLFGVRVFGSVAALLAFGLLGSVCSAGLGLLVASRATNSQTASGLMNLVTMPMMGLSGVFFSASHFPSWAQPVIGLLPLTALIDGLRALMIDGASLLSLGPKVAVLVGWGVFTYGLALKWFRWV